MSSLRQLAYGLALLAALGLLLWSQHQQNQASTARAELNAERLSQAEQRAQRQAATISTLAAQLTLERTAQASLRTTQNLLHNDLNQREQHIERLKRENAELKNWSAQRLPDSVVRLRSRPALSGATAYRDWLSRSSPMPTASQQPDQQR